MSYYFGIKNFEWEPSNLTSTQDTSISYGLVGWIIEASGDVLLKRSGWSDYQPTSVGTELYPGDILHPARGVRVLVQCANGTTIWSVPDGVRSGATNGCPPQTIPVSRHRGDIIPPRGGINPLIPYIISPRRTLLLNPLPTFCWNPVAGASYYNVSLIADDEVLWQTQVKETKVVYSGEPPLESGVDYLLIIQTDTGVSSQEEDVPDLGFSLLDENQITLVRDSVEQWVNLDLTDKAKSLALVHLYLKYDLKAEAIATLEDLIKWENKPAQIYRILGELYTEVGLNLLSQKYYLKAMELTRSEDIEGQALVAAGLGKVYEAIASPQEAIRWLTQARDSYAALGDTQRALELDEKLTRF